MFKRLPLKLNQSIKQSGLKSCQSFKNTWVSNQRYYATSTSDVEYEIDYISLTKTPKTPRAAKIKAQKSGYHDLPDEVINKSLANIKLNSDGKKFEKALIEKSINKVNEEFDEKLNNFVLRYSTELEDFLKFIVQSYDKKITSFGQLTSIELLNCLYIFKDLYSRGKVPNVNKYNYISYNYMFENFLKFLKGYSNFPEILNDLLLINNVGIDMLMKGLGSYVDELKSLTREFDFNQLESIDEISNTIDVIVEDFDSFLNNKGNLNYNEEFFKLFIQINKYRSLQAVLKNQSGLLPRNLLSLINSPNFLKINQYLKGSTSPPNLDLIKFLLNEGLDELTYVELITKIYNLKSDNPKVQQQINSCFNNLIDLCCKGDISYWDKFNDGSKITKFIISNNKLENFEFSMIYKYNLFNYVDEIKLLQEKLGSFSSHSNQDVLNQLNSLKVSNDLLDKNFNALKACLVNYFEVVSWENSSLDNLVANKNWMDWCKENVADRQRGKKLTLIDYSNFSNYPYKSINVKTELAGILPSLARFSTDNDLDLSNMSIGYLLVLLNNNSDIYKLYLDYGDCYISNLQSLIEDFKKVQFQLLNYNLDDLKDQLGRNFYELSVSEVEELNDKFAEFGIQNPLILDNLVELYKSVPVTEASYSQIPDELELHLFAKELEIFKQDELEKSYTSSSVEEITSLLNKRIKEILSNLNSKPESRLNFVNVFEFIKLSRKLNKLFSINGGYTNILDTLINSQKAFEKFESSKQKSYTQLPDKLFLHLFTKELEVLRQVLGKPFANSSVEEVMRVLNSNIQESTSDSLKINDNNVHNFVKLSNRLSELFSINGGYTDVLDVLIYSQSVFDDFEQKLRSKSKTGIYRQIPDDFKLDEYVMELMQLKNELGSAFKNNNATHVLETLKSMSNNESKFNSKKRNAFAKLYRNLSVLFKHNGNATFVLDNVLLNKEAFDEFEMSRPSLAKNKFESLIDKYTGHLTYFLSYNNLLEYELNDLQDLVSLGKFEGQCDEFLSSIKLSKPYYLPFYKELVNTLINYSNNGNDLLILFQIYKLRVKNVQYNVDEIVDKINSGELISPKFKENIQVPIEDSRFNIKEFIDDDKAVSDAKVNYNDPNSIGVKEASNLDDSELYFRNQIFHGLNDTEKNQIDPNEVEEIMNLATDKIRSNYRAHDLAKKIASKEQEESDDLNAQNIQDYLENTKQDKDLRDERKFREKQAYEWSRDAMNSNRSLERKNFFNPLGLRSNSEYLLLTINGEKIVSNDDPLGKKEKHEDMFTVLNKFDEQDLNKFIKNVNRLQRKNWRLIGGGGEGDKMLVFTRPKPFKQETFLMRLKSVLAMAGATFMILLGVNYWLDDYDISSVAGPGSESKVEDESQNAAKPTFTPETEASVSPTASQASDIEAEEKTPSNSKVPKGWFWS